MKRVNTFVDFRTELVEGTEKEEGSKKAKAEVIEGSSKRAGDKLEQEVTKKQKIDDDQEAAKMKELMKIVPGEEEVAIDAIPLATKPPRDVVSCDELYDSLVQFEPHVLASKAKKVAKNRDPLALLAHSNASSSQSHVNSSYSPQAYYVTHPSSVANYEDEYQGEL
ncbi:hypothetical protein Tco_0452238 [Tanacetum coccineum]